MVDARNESRMYRLYRLVLSLMYPQKNEKGIAKKRAAADMTLTSTNDPPTEGQSHAAEEILKANRTPFRERRTLTVTWPQNVFKDK
jgi:hypothetical protein